MPISGVGGGAPYVPPDSSKVEGAAKDFKLLGTIPDNIKKDLQEYLTLVGRDDKTSTARRNQLLSQLLKSSQISAEDKGKISSLISVQDTIVNLQKQIEQKLLQGDVSGAKELDVQLGPFLKDRDQLMKDLGIS